MNTMTRGPVRYSPGVLFLCQWPYRALPENIKWKYSINTFFCCFLWKCTKREKKRQEIIHTAKGQGHQSLLSINPIVKITTESITEWIPSLCKGGAVHFCPPCLFNPAPFFFNTQKVFMSLIHRYSSPGSRGIQSFIHRLVVYPFSPVLFKP